MQNIFVRGDVATVISPSSKAVSAQVTSVITKLID